MPKVSVSYPSCWESSSTVNRHLLLGSAGVQFSNTSTSSSTWGLFLRPVSSGSYLWISRHFTRCSVSATSRSTAHSTLVPRTEKFTWSSAGLRRTWLWRCRGKAWALLPPLLSPVTSEDYKFALATKPSCQVEQEGGWNSTFLHSRMFHLLYPVGWLVGVEVGDLLELFSFFIFFFFL